MSLASHQRIQASFLGEDDFSEEEIDSIVQWYADAHGQGDLSLVPFMSIWLDHDHRVLKGFRRWIESAAREGLPGTVGSLSHLHYYIVTGFPQGALYEAVLARRLGVPKRLVLDTIAHGFLQSGPVGLTPPADALREFLRAWRTDESKEDLWPEGWAADPAAFDPGLDFQTKGLTDDEIDALRAWYEKYQGEVPRYVDFMARESPEGLKSYWVRYEYASRRLPAQAVPLFAFHAAANLGRVDPMRRAAHHARALGVTRTQIMLMVTRAFVYASDHSMSHVAEVMEPLLEDWPA